MVLLPLLLAEDGDDSRNRALASDSHRWNEGEGAYISEVATLGSAPCAFVRTVAACDTLDEEGCAIWRLQGSTAAFCESVLRTCGVRTGLFTSPHLVDVRERIRIDGKLVDEEHFLDQFWWCWVRLSQ